MGSFPLLFALTLDHALRLYGIRFFRQIRLCLLLYRLKRDMPLASLI